jgi:hypothetical protein
MPPSGGYVTVFEDGLSHDPLFRSENNKMRRIAMTFVVAGLILAAAKDASAQKPWEDRVYMNIGFGVESGDSTLTDTRSLTIYEETGSVSTTSTFTSGSLFDVGIGFRLWKNLSVGTSYHQEQNDADAAISGTAPHPIFFNTPRSFTATATAMERKESAVHAQFGWMVPIGTKLDFLVFGGPSFFRLQQEVVSNVTVTEVGAPYTSVAVTGTRETRKQSITGYNVGVDMSYMVWQNDSVRLGGGLFVRYATAEATVLMLQTEQPTTVGGLQIGFGGRIRF